MFTDDELDALFHALAHAIRRRILDVLRDRPGLAVGALAQEFDVSRIAIMNHLRVLQDANLVLSEKHGRSRKLYLNATPIQMIHERWTNEYSATFANRVLSIKAIAEAAASEDQDP